MEWPLVSEGQGVESVEDTFLLGKFLYTATSAIPPNNLLTHSGTML